MRKIYYILIVVLITAFAVFFVLKNQPKKPAPVISNSTPNETLPSNSNNQTQMPTDQSNQTNQNQFSSPSSTDFQPPLARAGERITKKPFGIFITPQTSPVQPERFRGYHTGADFEIFPEELNATVPVGAVCSGKLAMKKYASGYGGVAVQNCILNGNPITIVYGHLKLASISANAGDEIKTGDTIGILGADKSVETNGERKHLHLGFHKGATVNILGYVQSQSELSGWIDPCLYVCHS